MKGICEQTKLFLSHRGTCAPVLPVTALREPVVLSLPRSKMPRPAVVTAQLPRVTIRLRLARPLLWWSPTPQCLCSSIFPFPSSVHSFLLPKGRDSLSWFPCILRAVSGSHDCPTQSVFSPQAFLELGAHAAPTARSLASVGHADDFAVAVS